MERVLSILRGWPWWLLVLVILGGGWLVGQIADGYVWRTLGAVGKVSAGLFIGYWAHRHLILQGGHIEFEDDSATAQTKRMSRALVMAACAIGVALAP